MSSQNERESEIEITNSVSFLDRIINPPEIPISNVISTLQSQSTTFSSSEGRPNSDEDLLVNPPFPPKIDPRVLANGLVNRQKKSKKMLNEFFIYRGEFVRELKRLNIRPKQTKVSSLASTSWHRQPPNVKDEYRRLARETENLFMAERQREAENKSPQLVSNRSTPKDLTSTSAPPTLNLDNFQLTSQTSQLEQQISNLQTITPNLENYCRRNTYYSNYSSYPNYPNDFWSSYLQSTPTTPYIVNPTSYYHSAETIVPSQSAQEADFFTNYHQTR